MALATWHKQTKQKSKNRNNVRLQFLRLYCVDQHQKLSWVHLSLQPPIGPLGSLVPLILRLLSSYSEQLRNYRLTWLFSLQISIMWGYSLRYCNPIKYMHMHIEPWLIQMLLLGLENHGCYSTWLLFYLLFLSTMWFRSLGSGVWEEFGKSLEKQARESLETSKQSLIDI